MKSQRTYMYNLWTWTKGWNAGENGGTGQKGRQKNGTTVIVQSIKYTLKKYDHIYWTWGEVGREEHIQEWGLKLKLRSGVQTGRTFPIQTEVNGREQCSQHCSWWLPLQSHFLFPFLAIRWHSGNQDIAITYKLLIELKVRSIREEKEYEE